MRLLRRRRRDTFTAAASNGVAFTAADYRIPFHPALGHSYGIARYITVTAAFFRRADHRHGARASRYDRRRRDETGV